jgi:hypothetical protein
MHTGRRILLLVAVVASGATVLGPSTVQARKKSAPPSDSKPQVAQQDESTQRPQGEPPSVGPMDIFADVERGWNSGNVDPILRHFGSQKVAISIEGTGPSGGKFSRNQSYYLLKDLFRYTLTRKFEFVQYRKPNEEGNETFAVAERHYQKSDDGRLFKDKVYVSLNLERAGDEERWVISEIKSIR